MTATLPINEVRPLVARCLQKQRPMLLVSRPGVGKTSVVVQAARDIGADLRLAHGICRDPTDDRGIPMAGVVDGELRGKWVLDEELAYLCSTKRPTIWFWDDMGQMPTAIQAGAMQWFLGRQVNGHRLSPHVALIGATNRRQDRAGVRDILSPLVDRMWMVLHVVTSPDAWCAWAGQAGLPYEGLAYVRFNPVVLEPPDTEPGGDFTKQSTPRSIEMALRLWQDGLTDHVSQTAAAGESWACGFLGFLRVYKDLPDPRDVLKNPKRAAVPEKRDALYALSASLAAHVKAETFAPLVTYLERIQPEFQVLCIKDAVNRDESLAETDVYASWVYEHRDLLGLPKDAR